MTMIVIMKAQELRKFVCRRRIEKNKKQKIFYPLIFIDVNLSHFSIFLFFHFITYIYETKFPDLFFLNVCEIFFVLSQNFFRFLKILNFYLRLYFYNATIIAVNIILFFTKRR